MIIFPDTLCCSGGAGKISTRSVRLEFGREDLLGDIRNRAYVQSHVQSDIPPERRHMMADVCEAGNVDVVTRELGIVVAEVRELLYPYTKCEVAEGASLDDVLSERGRYVLELSVPESFSQTTLELLEHLVHEYLVCRVLELWLGMVLPDCAGIWRGRVAGAEAGIVSIKNTRRGALTRRMHP